MEMSKSSSKESRNEETTQEVEERQETKILKTESQMDVEVEQLCINDLPQEMLMTILKNVDAVNLLACRVANRNWNVIANELIRSKVHPDIKINCFELDSTPEEGKRSLQHFLNHFENSKNVIFSRFLCQITNFTFDHTEWTKFISDFGENIKCLKLEISYDSALSLEGIEKKLRVLLSSQLPNLQEFGVNFHLLADRVKAFARRNELLPAGGLPNLKVLYFDADSLTSSSDIVSDLLRAAVNLESIQPFKKDKYFTLSEEALDFLNSHGKLECLHTAELKLNRYFLREIKSMGPMTFKLKTLKLHVQWIYHEPNLHTDATDFLQNLFESSKDTLTELTMEPIGFFQQLQLPKLNKLTHLAVQNSSSVNMDKILPSGINPVDVFPVLYSLELKLSWTRFPQVDFCTCFPNVKTLKVAADGLNETAIYQISRWCPNLKNFTIGDKQGPLDNFPEVAEAIWTRMKQLESLKLWISVNSQDNAFPAVDSCITGFSTEECIRLYDLNNKNAKKLEAPQSSEMEESERETESILNLKDLRNLTVGLAPSKRPRYGRPSREMMNRAITFISKEHALKLMYNLTYKIERETKK